MRIRVLLIGILIVGKVNTALAVLYPVTGDSTTVWNGIDLLPAEQNNVDLSAAAEGQPSIQSSPATDSVRQSPVDEQPAVSVEQAAPSPAAAAPEAAPAAEPVKAPVREVTAPAATVTEPVSTRKSQNAGRTTVAASPQSQTTVQKHAQADTATQPPDTTPAVAQGTLIITSVPDSVSIIINDISVGITPYHATGFFPGLYEITLNKNGYEPFRKTVDLKENGTEFITGTLVRETGYLFVTSAPEKAIVFLNDTAVGATPFHSKPLTPGIYRLRVELPEYTPYTERLGISSKLTDTIQVSLVSLKKPGFAERLNLKKSRTARRISFGAVGVVAGVAGLVLNKQTADKLSVEQKAWDNYSVIGKTTAEYTQLYDNYIKATKNTDEHARARNIFSIIGIISGVGFFISIPF